MVSKLHISVKAVRRREALGLVQSRHTMLNGMMGNLLEVAQVLLPTARTPRGTRVYDLALGRKETTNSAEFN